MIVFSFVFFISFYPASWFANGLGAVNPQTLSCAQF